jgi:hypothetical protein
VPSMRLVAWIVGLSAATVLGIQHYQKMKG